MIPKWNSLILRIGVMASCQKLGIILMITSFEKWCYQKMSITQHVFLNWYPSMKQDSKELSPRALDKMLLKRQVNTQNVRSTQLSKFFKFSNSYKLSKFFCMIFKHAWTCSNMFRFNMIQIVTIHAILKYVWTCWNMSKLVQIQYDMNCYDS